MSTSIRYLGECDWKKRTLAPAFLSEGRLTPKQIVVWPGRCLVSQTYRKIQGLKTHKSPFFRLKPFQTMNKICISTEWGKTGIKVSLELVKIDESVMAPCEMMRTHRFPLSRFHFCPFIADFMAIFCWCGSSQKFFVARW